MTIQLNPEQEKVVGQAIRAGLIRAHDDVVEVGVASIRQRLKASPRRPESVGRRGLVPRVDRLESESHATTPLLPDEALDRDSIYGARGL